MVLKVIDYIDEDTKKEVRGFSINGVIFDWAMGISEDSHVELLEKLKSDKNMYKALTGEAIKNFLKQLGEFLGRPISLKELNESIEKGEINE